MTKPADAIGKSNRIRVCIVAPSLNTLGGQCRQAARLLEGLRNEPTLEVSYLPHDPRLPGVLRKLQTIKYVRTVITTLLYLMTLVLRLPRANVVHVFAASYYSYLLSVVPAILVAKMYGKQIIVNYRSGQAEDHLTNWRWTAVPTMRLAGAIVVPSNYLVDVFARFGLKARAIFNIVELDRFRFRERNPLRPVFLCSRLLEPLYNVGCVLRAFACIQRRYQEAQLTIAAEGPMRAELERLARDLDLRHTRFIGRVPFHEMPSLYDHADIYLTASDLDNMPASITESFASGVLVVTTNAGGIPYILTHEETGLMVRCGDHEALAASAIRLLEDPELAARLARNAAESARCFTWPAVREEWLSVYGELASFKTRLQRGLARAGEKTVNEIDYQAAGSGKEL